MRRIAFLSAIAAFSMSAQTIVTADFSIWEEDPLVKKIGLYQTPLTTRTILERDMPRLSELESRTMRYEIAWGKNVFAQPTVSGSVGSLLYDFSGIDYYFNKARPHCQSLVISHGYCPPMLVPGGGTWQSVPSDLEAWGKVNRSASSHWRETGITNHYVEIWNEPDLWIFSNFGVEEYKEIYRYGATAVRVGDPDVKIGGPVGAGSGWHLPLVQFAKSNSLPLDFLSGHAYGEITWQLDAMRDALRQLGNNQAEMLLTEYSPYQGSDMGENGKVEHAEAAMTFFNALPTLLAYHDLSYVNWAQYIDPTDIQGNPFGVGAGDKMGLIDARKGFRKALFNAFKIYGWMPVDRCSSSAENGIRTLASADGESVCLVAWNTDHNTDKPISLNLTGIPFKNGHLEVYHIDETTNSSFETGTDDLIPSLVEDVETTDGNLSFDNIVRKKGVTFVRISGASSQTITPGGNVAKIIRTHQWSKSRNNREPYASFDCKTWTARMSMNEETNGSAYTGVTVEDIPESIRVTSANSGNLNGDMVNSTLNFRIDYQNASGEYVKSVLFHGGLYNETRSRHPEWGTASAPDVVVKVDDFADFSVDTKEYAPEGFSGRAIFTFELGNTGKHTKAKITVEKNGSYPRIGTVKVTDIATGSANLQFKAGSVSENSVCGFIYSKDSDPIEADTSEREIAFLSGNCVEAKIDDLDLLTSYHVRGFIQNPDGSTLYTPESVFRSAGIVAEVTTFTPSVNFMECSATVNGKVMNENGSEAYETGFLLCRGADSDPAFSDTKVRVSKGTSRFSYNFTGLVPDETYSVKAYAFTEAGVGYGVVKSFTVSDGSGVSSIVADKTVMSYDPAIKSIMIDNTYGSQSQKMKIYDINGKLIEIYNLNPVISVSHLETGLYIAILGNKLLKFKT